MPIEVVEKVEKIPARKAGEKRYKMLRTTDNAEFIDNAYGRKCAEAHQNELDRVVALKKITFDKLEARQGCLTVLQPYIEIAGKFFPLREVYGAVAIFDEYVLGVREELCQALKAIGVYRNWYLDPPADDCAGGFNVYFDVNHLNFLNRLEKLGAKKVVRRESVTFFTEPEKKAAKPKKLTKNAMNKLPADASRMYDFIKKEGITETIEIRFKLDFASDQYVNKMGKHLLKLGLVQRKIKHTGPGDSLWSLVGK